MFITRTGFCVGKFTSSISLGPASSRSYSRVNCYFFGRRTHITELNSSRCHNFLTLAPQVDHPRLRVRSKDIFLSQRKSKADKVKNENSLCTETIMQYSVHHDAQKQLFSIELSSGKALLEYDLTSSGIVDLYHTEVPVSERGKGIAKFLVQAALEFAIKNDYKITPTCTYVQKYIKDNPDESVIERVVR